MSSMSKFPVEGRTVVEVQEVGYRFPSIHGETYNAIMSTIQKNGIKHEDVLKAWDEFKGLNLSWLEGLTPAEMLASQYTGRPWLVSKAFKLLDLRQAGLGNVSQDATGNWIITGKIQRKVSLQPAEMHDDLGMKMFKEIMQYTKYASASYEKALIAFKVIGSNFKALKGNAKQGKAEMLNELRHALRDFNQFIEEGDSDQAVWTKFWDACLTPILDKCHGKSVFGWSREYVKLDHTEQEKTDERDAYPSGPAAHYSSVYKWVPVQGADGKTGFRAMFNGTSEESIALEEADFVSDKNIERGEDFQDWRNRLILADVAQRKATRLDYEDFTRNMVELRAKARWIKNNLQKELDLIAEKESEIYKLRNLFQEETDLLKKQEIAEKGKALVQEFKGLENRSMFEGSRYDYFLTRSKFYPNWFKPEELPEEKPKHTGWPQEKLMRNLCLYSRNEKCKRDMTAILLEAMKAFPDKSFEFLLEQYKNLGGKPGKVDMRKIYIYRLSVAKSELEVQELRALVDCKA